MRANRAKTPATMPTTAPLMSLETFSLSSAFASAIFSRTSSTARPSSDICGGSVDKALQHPREDERARERGADHHLGAIGDGRGAARGACLPGPVSRGGGCGVRRGVGADAGRGHGGAGHRGRLRGPLAVGLSRRLVGLLARDLGGERGLLGLLALAAGAARELLLLLRRVGHVLLGRRDVLLAATCVGCLDVAANLGGPRLSLGDGALVAHSGGSSPKRRTQIRVASLVVMTVASAPIPATRPDHIRRLTIWLSVMVGRSLGRDAGGLRLEPVADRLDDVALRALVRGVVGFE